MPDRFDLRLHVGPPGGANRLGGADGEPGAVVARRVVQARRRAAARGHGLNASLRSAELDVVAPLTPPASRLLEHPVRSGKLTGRGVERVRRVARTIADLAGHDGALGEEHVAPAVAVRVPARATTAVAS